MPSFDHRVESSLGDLVDLSNNLESLSSMSCLLCVANLDVGLCIDAFIVLVESLRHLAAAYRTLWYYLWVILLPVSASTGFSER